LKVARRFIAGYDANRKLRPGGTLDRPKSSCPISIPEIFLIILNLVLFQEREIFLLKAFMPMMFFLIFDVGDRFIDMGYAYAERTIALLPRKMLYLGERLVNPH
jgi:hypothetical protein